MARQYKTTHKLYTAWNYRKEIEDLNEASKKGWQLIKYGAFSQKFKWNPDVRYRYQLDYQRKIEEMGRYIETFREQGWEYVDSENGWHCFRKLYDPSLPEEQYEIFTDMSSMRQMHRRWQKVSVALSCLSGIAAVLYLVRYFVAPAFASLMLAVVLMLELAFLIRGTLIMRNIEHRKNSRWDAPLFALLMAVALIGTTASIVWTANRNYFSCDYNQEDAAPISAQMSEAYQWNNIEISLTDIYRLDLEIDAETPLCFSVVNEAGEIIYSVKDSTLEQKDIQLILRPGTYSFCLSDFAGGDLSVEFNLH